MNSALIGSNSHTNIMIWFISKARTIPFYKIISDRIKTLSTPVISSVKIFGLTLKYAIVGYCVEETFLNFIGYTASINGRSMQPTLNPKSTGEPSSWVEKWIMSDWVWVNCWRAHKLDIGRGDIIVYISPKTPNEYLIKRVIATAGDIVDTNGKYELSRVRIPAGHVWVHGDNRNISVDSNT